MTANTRARLTFVALALGTIALGLWVHGSGALGAVARDVLGDALWATMIAWWIGALTPRTGLAARGGAAFGICVLVELSQRIHTPWLDAVRETTMGRLVLGSGFDPRDIAAYALGVAVAAGSERATRARGSRA